MDDDLSQIDNPISVFPKPQRMFPEDARPAGGQYLNARTKEDMTGHKAAMASIGVNPGGRPYFNASPESVEQTGSPGRGSAIAKTNLFKQKAGWNWLQAPEGHEDTNTIVSVEHRGDHHYALNAHFPKGVDLARYAEAKSEPRLRPTTRGNLTKGTQVGSISVRGKEHPVYDHVIVKADGGIVGSDIVQHEPQPAPYIEEGSFLHTHSHPETESYIQAVTRPQGRRSASITSLYVPEEHRGKNIGKMLLQSMMKKFPSLQGQVSSKAAAKNAYTAGRRLAGNEDASLEDIYKKIDEDSSVNLWTRKTDGGIVGDPDTDEGITAYHGSPHDFEQFDISKIGTGEGAQAFGHGLYFAGNEEIAKDYRNRLTDKTSNFRVGNIDMPKWILRSIESAEDKNSAIEKHRQDFLARLAEAEEEKKTSSQPWLVSNRVSSAKDILDGLDQLQQGVPAPHTKGRMYEVHINARPEHFLDWDKPLREQPHIMKAIDDHIGDPEIVMQQLFEHEDATGQDFHDKLGGKHKPAAVAEKLASMGLRGIQYLDAGSRRDKEVPSRNYVIFDDKHVNVKRKYARGGSIVE